MKTIGITIGDTNGIGPEVAVKAAFKQNWGDVRIVLIGPAGYLLDVCEVFGFDPPDPWDGSNDPGSVSIWEPEGTLETEVKFGEVDPAASTEAARWITFAVKACQGGVLDAMVTAPICKEGFHEAGIEVPGHTELLAQLTKSERVGMLLVGGPLRVGLVTRHLPIREVPDAITPEAIREITELVAEVLPRLGVQRKPNIGICGLNPHAGDGGTIGVEDRDIIAPTVEALRKDGLFVDGPIPADTIFHNALSEIYDAVIAMYHDQGLAPLKMLAFDIGVNITLGLPIVRTSPDHGTAFAIAGKGVANASSMVEAIKTAIQLSETAASTASTTD